MIHLGPGPYILMGICLGSFLLRFLHTSVLFASFILSTFLLHI